MHKLKNYVWDYVVVLCIIAVIVYSIVWVMLMIEPGAGMFLGIFILPMLGGPSLFLYDIPATHSMLLVPFLAAQWYLANIENCRLRRLLIAVTHSLTGLVAMLIMY